MPGNQPTSSTAARDKDARIDAILADVVRSHETGSSVDAGALERAHPELMPELRQRLSDLRAAYEARAQTAPEPHQTPADETPEAWISEDLEFLRRSLANYEVLGRIRHGGQGVVYAARQKGADRPVAIKVLLDGPLATERQRVRFEREIELSSRLQHPNIVRVYDTGIVRGRHYYTMEYVEGVPIDKHASAEDLTPREIVQLLIKVCRAVNYAHQHGVIHRDLSPANILVDEAGEPHVFDFGLAKDAWVSDAVPTFSVTGQVVGTLPFLSPEQAGGLAAKVDVRSDVYTLGVLLYLLLTDGFPYPLNGEPQHDRDAILNTEAEPLRRAAFQGDSDRIREQSTINRDLEIILAKALAKEKDGRYQSAAAFTDDLQRWLAGDAIAARANHRFYVLRKTFRRYRVAASVAALILLTLAFSWTQIRAQRDNARQAVQMTFGLFDSVLSDTDKLVRPLAGGVAVRDEMIAGLADRLPQLEALVGSDEALDPIAARLAEQQGDLAHEQGRRAEATRYYKTFLDGSRRLAELNTSETLYLDCVTRAYRKYAELSDDPVSLYERGVQHAEEVLRQDPLRDGARYNASEIHVAFGKHLVKLEDYRRALQQLDAGLAQCPSEDPAVSEQWAQLAAVARDARGRVLLNLGDGAAGLADLDASLQIRERVVEARPANTIARYELMKSYIYVATAQRDAGHLAAAKELLHNAITLGKVLRTMDPTVAPWGLTLYAAHDDLARLHLADGELAEAQAQCDSAVALAEERAATYGRAADTLSTLAFAQVVRGQVLLALQLPRRAYAAFEEAAQIRASLLVSEPQNSRLRDSFAATHGCLGESARALNRHRQAAEHYQIAYDIRRELYEEQPDVVERSLDLIRSHVNLAATFMDCETEADDALAAKQLEEGERLLEKLHVTGMLVGFERKQQAWISAIRANQAIIRDRAGRHAQTDGEPDAAVPN